MSGDFNIKEQQIGLFRKGEISQSTLLKVLRLEISEMLSMGFKPREIKKVFEDRYDIEIKKVTLYSWLRNNRKKLTKKGEDKNEEKSIKNPPQKNHVLGSVANSQKDTTEEVEVSKNDTSNDSEKSTVVNIPKRKHPSKLDDEIDTSEFNK